jgi:CDP-glucose 4,6-dehydratase
MSGFWQYRNVLVTGCTGLLGGWVVQELLARGATTVGLVRDWVPRSRLLTEDLLAKLIVVRGTLEDQALLERGLNEYAIDTVFHLAAQTIVTTANRNPVSTFESNIRGTWTVLEACRRVGTVKGVVVASSDKAYGAQERLPYEEGAPLLGRFPYDVSKSCADLLAQGYAATYGLPVAITRCGNFFGGGDLNFSRIVPGTILSALRNEAPIIRSDGTYVRDYLYVRDGALACLLLAEALQARGLRGEAFNFSYELRLTAREMVDRILALMGRADLAPVVRNEATNEIPHQYLSSRKAREALAWRPAFGLDQGLTETISWYRHHAEVWGAG